MFEYCIYSKAVKEEDDADEEEVLGPKEKIQKKKNSLVSLQ